MILSDAECIQQKRTRNANNIDNRITEITLYTNCIYLSHG